LAVANWYSTATNTDVAVNPANGSLGMGQSQTLTTSQTSGGLGTDLDFTSNGVNAKVSVVCNPG
jgi:hypothetical protein